MPIPEYTHYVAVDNLDILQPYEFEVFAVRNLNKVQYTLVVKDQEGEELTRCTSDVLPWVSLPGHDAMDPAEFPDGLKAYG